MTGETCSETKYHPDFSEPDANIIVKSEDGVPFRVHDFFLKARSPVFRDMLSLSAGLHGHEIPLPESADDLAILLQVLTNKVAVLEHWSEVQDLAHSLKLYRLARKDGIEPCNYKALI